MYNNVSTVYRVAINKLLNVFTQLSLNSTQLDLDTLLSPLQGSQNRSIYNH